MKKNRWLRISGFVLSAVLVLGSIAGCSNTPGTTSTPTTTDQGVGVLKPASRLKVATTSSLYDTGLWALLEPMFEKEYGVEVDVLYANTGIAIQYGQRGDVDIITVHDKARELTFIADGYGTTRSAFAYNYFVIVGPASDPLGLKGLSAEEAFKKLAASKTTPFVSRGDSSGTHSKEQAIWKAAGFNYTDIRNSGAWYVEAGQGMGPTLQLAAQKQAYTLSDVGTFLAYKSQTGLTSIVDKGSILLNVYAAIPVNPAKVAVTNSAMATKMAEWLMSPAIQKIIGDYGVKDFGTPLFTPCAGNEPTG
ncbi:tungstate transport system substrate-binding protein [Dehalogenimonas formicexedens]|uniref:Tungstate transport system substrate-binding protein n=1 Tax=Dehalogenimonas formicexedens TaxID=1839801 RepID=A0A1P8F893_9CHLR|nr:substrate-binding domain-containing protein [Dehalogenimonas formicexedens]APV44653.1 tungstate transport system substrate-binding protein [Dehalogenimonas formicexedens]